MLANSSPVSEFDLHSLVSRRVEAVLRQAKTHAEQVIKTAKEQAAKAADRLRLQFPEWKVHSDVRNGTPAWELIDAGNDWNPDLIIVSTHGHSAII